MQKLSLPVRQSCQYCFKKQNDATNQILQTNLKDKFHDCNRQIKLLEATKESQMAKFTTILCQSQISAQIQLILAYSSHLVKVTLNNQNMFHCSNEEFLLSFAASEGHPNQSEANSEVNQQKNDDFNNDKLSQNRYSTKEQPINLGCAGDVQKENSPKRRRIVKKFSLGDCFPKNRKMSGDNLEIKGDKQGKGEEQIKSEKSLEMEVHDAIEEVESGKSIQNNSYIYDVNEVEGSYLRKIRNLQVRIKNMTLNHNTILIKMRQQNQALSKQNSHYQHFVKTFCPEIMDQLDKYMLSQLEKEEEMSMFSSSSSNNQSNDQQMPILSKIQQLKIDGAKMIETIKNYQEILTKKKEVDAQILRLQEGDKKIQAPIDAKKRLLQRKYSIPVGLQREKKLSFNEVKEVEVTNSSLHPERYVTMK